MRRSFLPLLLLFAVALGLGARGSASAHAALISSEPAANGFLRQSPPVLVMRFNEPLDTRGSGAQLLSATATGTPLKLGSPQFSDGDRTMTIAAPELEPGVYSVVWLNVSTIDGHAITGSFPFTILNADGTLPAGQASALGLGDPDPSPLFDAAVVRALTLLALILVVAGVVVPLLGPAAEVTPLIRKFALLTMGAAGLLLVATLLSLPGIRDTYSGRPLRDVLLDTPAGGYFIARFGLALLVATAASFFTEAPRRTAVAVAASVVVYLACFTATSHAAAANGSGWAMGFDLVHGVAATFWLGTVLSLAFIVRLVRGRPELQPLLGRVALIATFLVYMLLATGGLSAVAQIDSLEKLTSTRYGVTLLIKLGLIVPLLAVGLYNSRWGRAGITGSPASAQRFVRTATLEVSLGLAVVLVAAILTQSVVPRSIADTSDRGTQVVTVDGLEATLQAAPNVVGLNSFRVDLKVNGQPVPADRVRLTFRSDENPGAASTLVLEGAGTGTFLGSGAFLNQSGAWTIDIEVRRPGEDDLVAPVRIVPDRPLVATSLARWGNPAAGLDAAQTLSLAVFALGLAAMYTGVAAARLVGDWRLRAGGSVGGFLLVSTSLVTFILPDDPPATPIASPDRLEFLNLALAPGASGGNVIVGQIRNYGTETEWIVSAAIKDVDIGVAGALTCDAETQAATIGMPIPLPPEGTTALRAGGCRLELFEPVTGPTEVTLILNSGRRIIEKVE